MWVCLKIGCTGVPPKNGKFSRYNDDKTMDFEVPYFQTNPCGLWTHYCLEVTGTMEWIMTFPSYWEWNNHPNWLIFFRGVGQPPSSRWWIGKETGYVPSWSQFHWSNISLSLRHSISQRVTLEPWRVGWSRGLNQMYCTTPLVKLKPLKPQGLVNPLFLLCPSSF